MESQIKDSSKTDSKELNLNPVKSENICNSNDFFNEFVSLCTSLEQVPADRERLSKKLNKRYKNADPEYTSSQHFKNFVKKLLAKKIRELEETEVDLSDEENSTYVKLQRHRKRFCTIYKKLCKYTNENPDANRIYLRKICFSGSKYPNVNKIIENWLNETKRFPDFTDIVKLLENQSSYLDLSTNDPDKIRLIGNWYNKLYQTTEIFQQVGVMLQERRKYDLWDSFCGFLKDSSDPAEDNPELKKIFKENFDNRVKKEQEIFAHYSEIQTKQGLKAKEVQDNEANESPIASSNEESEPEEIESSADDDDDKILNISESSLTDEVISDTNGEN
ncbi:conserved hypothetical protein [Pediculus humanus corporis]|uniref:Daxx histone-binding domain-containing protein n=1 Tax=Pediculus humanus subsp. corporis TaxID=121224 RepID=E0VPC5_PEDHC|nr:uncharacterized protein Phum_PHUM357210 [Pediculus humanus corporis]EEB15231.1 conserved hypothetical protein [Pediculus humanus corporis]